MTLGSNVRMWATAVSTNADNGRRIVFRYAEELSGDFDKRCQPVRVIIAWRYVSENGQPTSEEHQRMNELEDALESVLDDGGFATLALVSTGECLREWIYYAVSETEFMARLNYALAGFRVFPIEVHTACDPKWRTYEEFTADVKELKA